MDVDGPTKAVAVVTDAPRRNNFIAGNFMFDLIMMLDNNEDNYALGSPIRSRNRSKPRF